MKHYNKIIKTILPTICILLFMLTLPSCGNNTDKSTPKNKTKTKLKLFTTQMKSHVTNLYYSGNIQPIRVTSITSPVEGTISKIYFKYGTFVKKEQRLLLISSKEFQKNYRTNLTAFLTAKQKFNNARKIFSGTILLYKDGLIAKNTFITDLANLRDAHLTLIQARTNLEELLFYTALKKQSLELLQLDDPSAVEKALTKKINQFTIVAASDGIALIPAKSSQDDSGTTTKIGVGSQVKQGQSLVEIGDMRGISLTINIDEIAINQINPGLKAIISSPVLPNVELHGFIKYVSSQANTDSGGGLPTFSAVIDVPKIPENLRPLLHVGVSAKVTIIVKRPPTIVVPINAVQSVNGQSIVQVYNPKTKTIKKVVVTTGKTTLSQVEITSGLKAGDKIVLDR